MKAIKLITKFKLSIIIPIYNSEKTLKNCLNSICKQRKKQSIEIILVNDCSNDKSKEICNSYIKKFLTACSYCAGKNGSTTKIAAAQQTKQPLNYKKF